MRSLSSPHVGTLSRAVWSLSSGAAVAVLATARALSPDPRGFGTHEQLGLPACGWLSLTSLPCPACGLTTAFACMARGDVGGALHANVFGVPLFSCVLLAAPACAWAALRNLPLQRTYTALRGARVLQALALAWITTWIARVALAAS